MDTKHALVAALAPYLEPGEQVRSVTVAQVKRSAIGNVAKTAVASTVLGVASIALSGGLVQAGAVVSSPAVWCVATSERVLLIARGGGALDERVLVSAPRSSVTARLRGFPLTEVTLSARADGGTVVRLNLGVKRAAARAVVEALEPARPGTVSTR